MGSHDVQACSAVKRFHGNNEASDWSRVLVDLWVM